MKITINQLRQMVREALQGFLAEKNNPYAICTTSVGKTAGTRKRSEWTAAEEERYESCKAKVEKENK
tara:strand:- start:30 stop:230 length:201 start_codon:yes stop_codon:yes gene_type:complete